MTVTINGTSGITTPGVNSTGSNVLGDNVADTLNVGNGAIVTNSYGNVGIGTSSPYGRLTLSNGSDNNLEFWMTSPGGASASNIQSYNRAGSAWKDLFYGAATHYFNTGGSERMRIDSSGNLLVGKTAEAAANVGFAATPSVGYRATTTSGNYNICNTASATGTETLIQFRYSDAAKGGISCNGTTVTYNTSSDYRLKENVSPLQNALDVVAQLNPVTYTWKADGSDGQGFIAHELQAIVPDCVTGEKDAVDADGNPVYQGIDTSFLVATLTKAIQELSAKVDAQQLKIEALKGAAA